MKSEDEIRNMLNETESQIDLWQKAQQELINRFKKGEIIKNLPLFSKNMLDGLILLERALLLGNILDYVDFNNKKVYEDYKKLILSLLEKR